MFKKILERAEKRPVQAFEVVWDYYVVYEYVPQSKFYVLPDSSSDRSVTSRDSVNCV